MHCPGPRLHLLQCLHQSVGVQQPLSSCSGRCRRLLVLLMVRLVLGVRLDGLALQVGHALGLAPGVQVAPPLVDGTRVQQAEREMEELSLIFLPFFQKV